MLWYPSGRGCGSVRWQGLLLLFLGKRAAKMTGPHDKRCMFETMFCIFNWSKLGLLDLQLVSQDVQTDDDALKNTHEEIRHAAFMFYDGLVINELKTSQTLIIIILSVLTNGTCWCFTDICQVCYRGTG